MTLKPIPLSPICPNTSQPCGSFACDPPEVCAHVEFLKDDGKMPSLISSIPDITLNLPVWSEECLVLVYNAFKDDRASLQEGLDKHPVIAMHMSHEAEVVLAKMDTFINKLETYIKSKGWNV